MNPQIRRQFLQDLLLGLGILVAIFASGLAVSPRNRDFTTRSALISGDRLLATVQDLSQEVLFDAGWSGHATAVADALGIELKSADKPTTSLLAQVLSPSLPPSPEPDYQYGRNLANTPWGNLPENDTVVPRVAGAVDDTTDSVNTPISDTVVPTGFIRSADLSDGRVVVEYRPQSGKHVDVVKFYLNGALVTTDISAPYYLGGDIVGRPRGYELEEEGKYQLRVEVSNQVDGELETEVLDL